MKLRINIYKKMKERKEYEKMREKKNGESKKRMIKHRVKETTYIHL